MFASDKPNHRILIVDDNPSIHDDFKKILNSAAAEDAECDQVSAALFGDEVKPIQDIRFDMDSAFQGQEGLALVEQSLADDQPYALAMVDMRMPPGWDGMETIKRICAVDDQIQIVICSAYSDYTWEEILERFGQMDRLLVLKKPFDNIEVLQLVCALAEKWRLAQVASAKMDDMNRLVEARTQALNQASVSLELKNKDLEKTVARLEEEVKRRKKATHTVRIRDEQLRQAQKMEAIGNLTGAIAHDFNNLLMVILGRAQLLEDGVGNLSEHALDIRETAERAAMLTRQLLAFGRRQMLEPAVINLNHILLETERMLGRLLGEQIEFVVEKETGLPNIEADPTQIQQIVMNLAINARDAMPDGGRLEICTLSKPRPVGQGNPEGEHSTDVCLSVRDTGIGIPQEIQEKIFDPFFTTKEKGKGTGLGLSTVHGVVLQSGGRISLLSTPGKGTEIRISFPTVDKPVVVLKEEPKTERSTKGEGTILLVEDEDAVRGLIREMLESAGYRVLCAEDAVVAERLFEQHAYEIALLLTDIGLPGRSGMDLARKLQGIREDLKVVAMTGYADPEVVHKDALAHPVQFLKKPFKARSLLSTVIEAMESSTGVHDAQVS